MGKYLAALLSPMGRLPVWEYWFFVGPITVATVFLRSYVRTAEDPSQLAIAGVLVLFEMVQKLVVQMAAQAVQIDVVERQAPLVLDHQDERRAIHLAVTGQPAADALREARLPRTELAAEEEDIAAPELTPEPLAHAPGFFLTGRRQFQIVLFRHTASIGTHGFMPQTTAGRLRCARQSTPEPQRAAAAHHRPHRAFR